MNRTGTRNSAWCPLYALLLSAILMAGCNSDEPATDLQSSDRPAASAANQPGTSQSSPLAEQVGTVHELTRRMIALMDHVNGKEIVETVRISDVRNQFFEVIDWLDDPSPQTITNLKKASEDLNALLSDIRSHENAQGDAALAGNVQALQTLNDSIQAALPQ